MAELTVQQRLKRAYFYLMTDLKWVAYAGVLNLGKINLVDDCPTAFTDGWNVTYGKDFIANLPDEEINGTVIHENLHKLLRHRWVWKALSDIDHDRANRACDYVINLMIQDAEDPKVVVPKCGLLDEKYRGMTAAEVFKLLPDSPPNQGGHAHGDNGCGGIEWDSDVTPDEAADMAGQIDSAIRQGAALAGRLSGNIPREFEKLMEVKLNYKDLMRDFANTNCSAPDSDQTWRPPSRRWMANHVMMPTTISEAIATAMVGIDTSGSISGDALNEFVSHAVAIFAQIGVQRLDLLYWDSAVCNHEIYFANDLEKMKSSTKPAGGGGTSPSCVTTYMKEHNIKPDCAIMLTDGWVGADWGREWPCPVLWVIKSNESAVPTTGAAAHF